MRYYDNGAFYTVQVSAADLHTFAQRWPCSGMKNQNRGMAFEFDKRNGDLVDIKGERPFFDEGAARALSEDAQEWARTFLECANCGGPLPEGHGTHSRTRPVRRFCDACAGIAEALAIGARKPAFLYDDNKGNATTWTGGIVGKIVHKTTPRDAYRRLAPIRYRVRMLDGSEWYGFGPSANGTYIRVRPMKGA